jgi:hypothetical protein
MKVSTDAMLVAGALAVAAFLAAQDSRQEWKVKRSSEPGMVQFHIKRSSPGSSMSQVFDVPLSEFQNLNLNANGSTRFTYTQGAGALLCEGRIFLGGGSGTFEVRPDPRFVAQLNDLGYASPTADQAFDMLVARVSLDFARGVREAGLRASTDQLIELRRQGVTLPYLQALTNAGERGFTAAEVIELKQQGVSPEFIRDVGQAGYHLAVARMIELKNQGIDSRYIRELAEAGLRPAAGDLIQFKQQGVSPRFLQEARDLGYSFRPDELIELKNQGVGEDYLRNLRASGMRNLTASQIVQLKNHGVE